MRRKLKQFFSPSLWLTLVLVILATILQTVVLIRKDKSAVALIIALGCIMLKKMQAASMMNAACCFLMGT